MERGRGPEKTGVVLGEMAKSHLWRGPGGGGGGAGGGLECQAKEVGYVLG